MKQYLDYMLKQAKILLAIDSPSGFTEQVTEYLIEEYQTLGYAASKTVKGGVIAELSGKNCENAVMLTAHVDTLGAMVANVKENGRLCITPIGGLNANNIETENCKIYTMFNGVFEGTCQLTDASVHVNGEYNSTQRNFDTLEIVLDEHTSSKEETVKLGIRNGDYICFSPRTQITDKGYIKSRFLDDKLSAAILLGYAKYIKDEGIEPSRKIYQYMTVFEEVGHGASASIPKEVKEIIAVDMGCVGVGLECTERQVSICAKDSGGPYNYEVVKGLIKTANDNNIDYATDIYRHYGSDTGTALKAGNDIKHGLIGPGVYASHGYERSHVDGVKNTFQLLVGYLR